MNRKNGISENDLKKKLFKFVKIFIVIFLFPFIIIQLLTISEMKKEKDGKDKKVDYVVVLGGRVRGEKPSRSLYKRIEKAAEYLKEHENIKVVASGGKGKGEEISEAEAIKRELVKLGISENRIITEDKSVNTVENFKFTLEKIKENESENKEKKFKILIVTNDYHVYRSKKRAELLGFEAYGLGAKTPLISLPKSYIREFASIIKYYFTKNSIK